MKRTVELVEAHVSDRTQWHFVVLRDGGVQAVGECSDAGDTAAVLAELRSIMPLLADFDLVAQRDRIVELLTTRVEHAARGAAFVSATVMGAIEQMLVDLAGQQAGEPAWKLLGGSASDPIQLYANINRMPGGRAPETVAEMARAAVAQGFTSVKCAPFDVPVDGVDLAAVGLARLRAVRAAIGEDVDLMVDCHERLTPDQVHQLLPAFADLGIGWLEDAVGIDDLDDLRELRAATKLPLAGGEVVFSPAELAPVAAEDLLDVVMPDVKHAGGMGRVLSIARTVPGVAVSPHNPAGPVATAASAHVVAACANATVLEYQFGETPWRSELVCGNERVVDGRLVLSENPGLGVSLRERHPSSRVLWSTTI